MCEKHGYKNGYNQFIFVYALMCFYPTFANEVPEIKRKCSSKCINKALPLT